MARIVIVGMGDNSGGVETYLMNFMEAMVQDNDLTFVNIVPERALAHTGEIHAAGAHVFATSGEYSLTSYFGRVRQARKILQHLRADVVYINALTTNFAYWVRAAEQLHIRSVFHSHNDMAVYGSRIKKLIATICKPFDQRVLKGTVQLAASLPAARFMFGKTQHATMIYNAIAPERWAFRAATRTQTRAMLGISATAPVVIVVARMHRQKNYPKIINIFAEMCRQCPEARLIVVGDGEDRETVRAQIETLHLTTQTLVLGQRRDVPVLMWASDVLLLPSIYEGLPFSVVEAQGAGLPVLASRGVVPEVANVTGDVHWQSLTQSDQVWAKQLLALATTPIDRLEANQIVAGSRFAFGQYQHQIRKIFTF